MRQRIVSQPHPGNRANQISGFIRYQLSRLLCSSSYNDRFIISDTKLFWCYVLKYFLCVINVYGKHWILSFLFLFSRTNRWQLIFLALINSDFSVIHPCHSDMTRHISNPRVNFLRTSFRYRAHAWQAALSKRVVPSRFTSASAM